MKHRILAALLTGALLLSVLSVAASAAPAYQIGNPYAAVNWDAWKGYKTQLHCHTNVSDGEVPLNEQVEEHYRLGYDALCITDHMSLGVPWNQIPKTVPFMRLVKYSRTQMLPIAPLTDERRQEMLTGVGRDGQPMLEVTQGVELNGAVPSNSHLQGWFCDYGQGKIGVDGDYETPVKGVQAAGGLSSLNHIGDTSKADVSDDPLNFYQENPKWANKLSNIFIQYSALIGMDINSGEDTHTKYDSILYDQILQKVIPYGRTPWAFTYSDAHSPGQFDRAFTVHMMPELNLTALRKSMETGAFFSVARYARLEVDEDFVGQGAVPKVTRITVSEADAKITIDAQYADTIVWISDGKEIARGATLDIAANDAKIGCYVRAYLTGSGGILYVQPFTVLRAGQPLAKEPIPKVFDYSNVLRFLADAITFLSPKFTPQWFAWQLLTNFDPAVDLAWLTNLFR
ncbi:MAG: PHP domain-containing protein [Oscillospiraceae bacterium]|jgi:hypothetical protein|nr:PHP domain-containing protein [Oscillospiraceae bacterium]